MSGNYSIMSFDPYMNNTQIQSKLEQARSAAAPQSDESIFSGSFSSAVDYSSAYDNILDQYYTTLDEIAAAEAAAAAEAEGEDSAAPAEGEDSAAPAGNEGTDPAVNDGTEPADEGVEPGAGEDEGVEPGTGEDEGVEPDAGAGEGAGAGGEVEPAAGEDTTATFTDEELILINDTVEDILDATVRVKTGPFNAGTDEKALIEIMSDETLTPELMRAVQAELEVRGHDIFELIRSETSGETEDVLEGYALAKLGGKSKESETELESYEKYQDMDKSSVEYQNYIRRCVSLFETSVNGWGTNEKVLAYIMSLPQDIRADVEARYNQEHEGETNFYNRGKNEVSGVLKTQYWGN